MAEKTEKRKSEAEARYPLRVQAIRTRGQNVRFFVYLPMPLAAALGVSGGEEVEWELLARDELRLVRTAPPPPKTKKRK
jgi:hypothetical protein